MEFGRIRGISRKLRGTQWNSVGFCMALCMNSVGIRATPDFRENLRFRVVSGDLGGQKAFAVSFAQIARNVRKGLLVVGA